MPLRIHIAWENVDTIVELASPRRYVDREYRTPDGQKVRHARLLNYDHTRRYEVLNREGDLIQKVVTGDPEVDLESTGESIDKTYRIFVDKEFRPAFSFAAYDVMTRPSGEVEERGHAPPQPNVNEAVPLKISEPRFTPLEIAQRFVIAKSYFLLHTDGVSFRFLYDIAKTLATAKKFAAFSAYDPVTLTKVPIVLFRGNPPFPAAFLEGRIKDDAYCLILHLSRQELKVPAALPEEDEGGNDETGTSGNDSTARGGEQPE